jgi:hypothetical protein
MIAPPSAATTVELAEQQFPLDLQPDQEEEDRHQAVVDPMPEGQLQRPVSEHQARIGRPQVAVRIAHRRIGDDQRKRRGGEHHDAAGSLLVQEV